MKLLFDFFPLIIFYATYHLFDLYYATAAIMIACLLQVGIHWLRHKKTERLHILTLIIVFVFGGLTLLLQNEAFIKWRPTVSSWIFSSIILFMLTRPITALEYVLGEQIQLPKPVWNKVNLAWGLFFFCLGALNLYVAFYYNLAADAETRLNTWVTFKTFWLMGLTLVFSVVQILFISKYITLPEKSDENTLNDNQNTTK